jgi:two-component system, OmpR family, phosphate regulon sensor histidine kinase PhoR
MLIKVKVEPGMPKSVLLLYSEMKQKNSLTVILMASSIVLLLMLQFFWLRGAYDDAADNFRKESSLLFRNTIFAMQDSLLQKSLRPVNDHDSLPPIARFHGPQRLRLKDSLIIKTSDSVFKGFTEKRTSIQIISSDEESDPSFREFLRPLASRLKTDGQPKTFVFRMTSDTLNTDSIRFHFSKTLAEADLMTEYKIIKVKGSDARRSKVGRHLNVPEGKFISEFVPLTPMTRYAAEFYGVPSLLIRNITPQIFFSIFLTVLTSISFYVMFRNMRSQQRLMEIKNDFISNVSHELKTPVATVSVALEALKNFNALHDPQKTKEYLDIAQRELNRLTLMTDKILKTSVYEDQGVTLKLEPIHIDHVIDQVLSSMRLVFEKKRTHLQFQKTGSDFSLDGSHEHLTNVFYNLVDNALKYSTDDSTLEVSLESLPAEVLIKVKDTGIGIPKEYKHRIFEKFFRVPSGDVHNTKGYGLGLSYVASVIESHQGEISVESDPGKGSCFTIRLPRHQE